MNKKKSFNERFVDFADKVSYGIGTPLNIGFWLFAVIFWIALGPFFATHSFLPSWFTSNGFNFPLNTVTTIAELYIGFLLAAAANRSQRKLEELLKHIKDVLSKVSKETDQIDQLILENTKLTKHIEKLTIDLHKTQIKKDIKEK